MKNKKFTNRIALVTGASKGIGFSIAKNLAFFGATVIGTATNKYNVSFINSYLGSSGKGLILNVSNFDSVKNLFNKIYKEFEKIDILVNNVGIIKDNLIVNMKENDWTSVINTNLNSVFYTSKLVIKNMLKNKYGRIINIGSIIGSIGNIGQTNYSASKAGIVGFSKSLAKEVAKKGITVNIVSPGFIKTSMTEKLTDKKKKYILSKIPMKRFGNPNDIANAVLFFASEEASYITGEILHVNGGGI